MATDVAAQPPIRPPLRARAWRLATRLDLLAQPSLSALPAGRLSLLRDLPNRPRTQALLYREIPTRFRATFQTHPVAPHPDTPSSRHFTQVDYASRMVRLLVAMDAGLVDGLAADVKPEALDRLRREMTHALQVMLASDTLPMRVARQVHNALGDLGIDRATPSDPAEVVWLNTPGLDKPVVAGKAPPDRPLPVAEQPHPFTQWVVQLLGDARTIHYDEHDPGLVGVQNRAGGMLILNLSDPQIGGRLDLQVHGHFFGGEKPAGNRQRLAVAEVAQIYGELGIAFSQPLTLSGPPSLTTLRRLFDQRGGFVVAKRGAHHFVLVYQDGSELSLHLAPATHFAPGRAVGGVSLVLADALAAPVGVANYTLAGDQLQQLVTFLTRRARYAPDKLVQLMAARMHHKFHFNLQIALQELPVGALVAAVRQALGGNVVSDVPRVADNVGNDRGGAGLPSDHNPVRVVPLGQSAAPETVREHKMIVRRGDSELLYTIRARQQGAQPAVYDLFLWTGGEVGHAVIAADLPGEAQARTRLFEHAQADPNDPDIAVNTWDVTYKVYPGPELNDLHDGKSKPDVDLYLIHDPGGRVVVQLWQGRRVVEERFLDEGTDFAKIDAALQLAHQHGLAVLGVGDVFTVHLADTALGTLEFRVDRSRNRVDLRSLGVLQPLDLPAVDRLWDSLASFPIDALSLFVGVKAPTSSPFFLNELNQREEERRPVTWAAFAAPWQGVPPNVVAPAAPPGFEHEMAPWVWITSPRDLDMAGAFEELQRDLRRQFPDEVAFWGATRSPADLARMARWALAMVADCEAGRPH